jgi:hypothetical protein
LKEKIFNLINNKIQSSYPFDESIFTLEDKEHLIGHWQLLLNSAPSPENFAIKNSGLCLLLAYVTLSIQG